jgi:hypothetical protein
MIFDLIKLALGFFPSASDREKAQEAAQSAYIRFLQTTDNPLYAALRVLEVLSATWDGLFNQGRAWQAAANNLGSNPWGVVEILIILWPFFGNTVQSLAVQAVQAGLDQAKRSAQSQSDATATGSYPVLSSIETGSGPAPFSRNIYTTSVGGR